MRRMLDQNCQGCFKPIPVGSTYLTVRQFFYHNECLQCRFCKKALTPAVTDMISNLPYCLGHRGKDVPVNTECPNCNKKFSVVQPLNSVLAVLGIGYHKECVLCKDCKKSHPEVPVDQFRSVGTNQLICLPCWEIKNPVKCASCAVALPQSQMNAIPGGSLYCVKCFVCTVCTIKLKVGDKVNELASKLYCSGCQVKYEDAKYQLERMKGGP